MRVAPTDVVEVVDHDVGIVDLDEAERIVSPSAIGAVGAVGAAGSETQTQPSGRPPSAGRDAAAAAAVAKLVASATPELSIVHRDAEDPFFRNRRKSIDSMFTGDGADGVKRSSGITVGKAGEKPGLTLHEPSRHAPAIKPDNAHVGFEKAFEKAGAHAQDSSSARSSLSEVPPVHYDSLGTLQVSTWRHKLNLLLDHAAWAWMITVLTVWALIADDLRLALCPKSVDEGFFAVTFVCLVIFTLEIAVQWLVRPEYRFSFYFGLDAVATVSLLPDVGWLWDFIMDQNDTDDAIGLSGGGDHDHDSALRAGRASRAGTRAARIIRIIRLVRVVRILKLYKVKQKKEGFPGDRALFDEDTDLEHFNAERKLREEPSNVGKKLTDLTTRRVILITLLLVIVNPFFSGALEEDTHAYQESGLERLHHYPQDYNYSGSVDAALFRTEVREWARNTGKLLYLDICGHGSACRTTWPVETVTEWLRTLKFQPSGDPSAPYDQNHSALTGWSPSQTLLSDAQLANWQDELRRGLRKSEMTRYRVFGCFARNGSVAQLVPGQTCVSLAFFDNREITTFDAGINVVKTVFIMLVLIGAMFFFSRDAQVLVIEPIERMMRLVKDLAANPLATIDEGLERDLTEQEMEAHEEGYETVLLEQSLSKIGGLLQVGFGVAGTEIIGKNMKAAGALNVMLPGKKITTVIGFGAIEEFTDSCTCLEEKICMYINTIAKIVHSDTHAYYGAANKNTGSAFLLCWKICDGMLPGLRDPRDPQRGSAAGLRRRGSTHKSSALLGEADMAADLNFKERARDGVFNTGTGAGLKTRNIVPMEMVESALCAFLKIQIDLHHANNRSLLEFTQADGILRRFGTGYRVSMTFGMHIGWAVEGAIGSRFKIDASYLSPNVNLAARLQAATSQLGVSLLLSEWFVDELGPQARNMCRRIDRVTVKGSETPMDLYTWDILNFPDHRVLVPKFDNQGRQRPVNFGVNPEFRDLQDGIEPLFLSLHKAGLEAYLAGRWEEASEKFEAALRAHHTGTDGPTQYVLDFMRSHNLKPPTDWNGFRRLMKKHHAYERFRDTAQSASID